MTRTLGRLGYGCVLALVLATSTHAAYGRWLDAQPTRAAAQAAHELAGTDAGPRLDAADVAVPSAPELAAFLSEVQALAVARGMTLTQHTATASDPSALGATTLWTLTLTASDPASLGPAAAAFVADLGAAPRAADITAIDLHRTDAQVSVLTYSRPGAS